MVAQDQCLIAPTQCHVAHSGVKYAFTAHVPDDSHADTLEGVLSGGFLSQGLLSGGFNDRRVSARELVSVFRFIN